MAMNYLYSKYCAEVRQVCKRHFTGVKLIINNYKNILKCQSQFITKKTYIKDIFSQ